MLYFRFNHRGAGAGVKPEATIAAEQRWNRNFEDVRRFRIEHGRWPKQREGALGRWYDTQRSANAGS